MVRPPPQVHALVVCEQVFQQSGSGKWCVLGTHNLVTTQQLPVPHQAGVFLSLGDFTSGSRFELVVRHDDGEVLCRAEAEAGMEREVGTLDVGLVLPPIVFPREGPYRFEVIAQDQVLAARTVHFQLAGGAMPAPQPAELQARALLLCDMAFSQHQTHKWYIVGVYDTVTLPALPAHHWPFVVFLTLSGYTGGEFVTATVRDNEGKVVYAMRGMFENVAPGTFDYAFTFPPIEFKRPGSHTLELEVGSRLLAMRSFAVRTTPAKA